jgi:hypothetical protein
MKWRKALIVAAALTVTAVVPASAQAEWRAYHPSDPSYGVVENDAHHINACDWHADGHAVYAAYYSHYSTERFLTGSDTYGRNADGRWCLRNFASGWGIRKFQICVQYEGCGPFRNVLQ